MSMQPKQLILTIVTFMALSACVISPILVFIGSITFSHYLVVFNIASLFYFFTAPFSFGK